MASTLRSHSLPDLSHIRNSQLDEAFVHLPQCPLCSCLLLDCPSEEPTPPWIHEEVANVFAAHSQESLSAQSLPEGEGCPELSWSESFSRRRVSSLSDISRYYRYYDVIRRHSDQFPWGYNHHTLFTSSPVMDDVPPECPVDMTFMPSQPSLDDCYIDDEMFLEMAEDDEDDDFESSMDMWEESNAFVPMNNEPQEPIIQLQGESTDSLSSRLRLRSYSFSNNYKLYLKL